MELNELTCIGCPMGCMIQIEMEGGTILGITGHTCKRGEIYARNEVISPKRIVTSTVRIYGGGVLPVKTREAIPKERIFACMEALKNVCVQAPVGIGDVLLKDAANTGVDVVATKNIL